MGTTSYIICLLLRMLVVVLLIFLVVVKAQEELVVRVLGGPEEARSLAYETGHFFKGPVLGFRDTYIFLPFQENFYPNHRKRGMEISKRLADDERVIFADTQTSKDRQKRDLIFPTQFNEDNRKFRRQLEKRKIYKKPYHPVTDRTFNDELWSQEWYLQDTRSRYDLPKLDLNVLPLYKQGVTGKGVRISILDDGIEYTHQDLKKNYDPEISYDCNEEDTDPLPRYEPSRFNSHGTRCAGEIAMAANNGKCGVGIAYNSRIGGVKMLDGIVTDRTEGTALSYAQHLVDIYSASWGPNDDGKTVDGPGRLAKEALEKGINTGRNGKGTIFVWASGNGGSKGDNCNCDGYLGSPYTISIGSASQKGAFPWYGEACASTLAVTYSSGAYKDQMIATTDLHNECTIKHTGTSASAPLAAGIIALALEVNPALTWRDVQHLIVWTSEISPITDNPGWQRNSVGFWFNTRFGFGLMNAFALVKASANWTRVPDKSVCTVTTPYALNETFAFGNERIIKVHTTGCQGTQNEVRFLEHVELRTTILYPIRGVIEVYLTSPAGSKVELLAPRKLDKSRNGFQSWTFMSVMTWGETAAGTWTVTVADNIGPEGNSGFVQEVTLIVHGTRHLPQHLKSGPRKYNQNYNRVHNTANKVFGPSSSDEYSESSSDSSLSKENFVGLQDFYFYL